MSHTEIEGLKRLKIASLILIITPVLIMIGIIGEAVFLFGLASLSSEGPSGFSAFLRAVVTSLVLLIVGIILGFIAIIKLKDGFRDLKSVFPEAGIGYTGGLLLLIGYMMFILYPLGLIFSVLSINPIFMILTFVGMHSGVIIYFIGQILTGIGFCRVGDRYNENLVCIGGILAILLPFLGYIMLYMILGRIIFVLAIFLPSIGYIILFIGLGRIVNRFSMGQQPYSPQPYQQSPWQQSGMPYSQPKYQPSSQPQNLPYQPATQQYPGQQPPLPQYNQPMSPQAPLTIYQTGPIASLRPDGIVTFQVYSTQLAQLISARIEDTGNIATSITPNFIPPNQITNVAVNFGFIPLVPGKQYRIIVTAIVNNSYIQFPVYANS